jgi:hypothetical protein
VRIRRPRTRLGQQERHLDRAAARGRERWPNFLEHVPEQLREPGERERSFRLGPPGDEHASDSLPRLLHAGFPEDRLADPRLAGEDQRGRALLDVAQKRLDRRELSVASDDRAGGHDVGRL